MRWTGHYSLVLLTLVVLSSKGTAQEIQVEGQSIGYKILHRLSFQVEGGLNFYKGGYIGKSNAPTPNASTRLIGFEQSTFGAAYALGVYADVVRYKFFTLSSGIVFRAGQLTYTAILDSVALHNPYSPYSNYVSWRYDIQLPVWLKFVVVKNLEVGFRSGIPIYSFGRISTSQSDGPIDDFNGQAFEIDRLSSEISLGYNLRINSSKIEVMPVIIFGGRFFLKSMPLSTSIGLRICVK